MIAAALETDTHEAWAEDAVATIIGLAHVLPEFDASDLTREMRPAPHPNAPGQAFSKARALGHITAVGYRQSTTPSRKNGVVRVWTRANKEES